MQALSRGEHVLLTPREDRIPALDGLEALNNDLAVVAHLALSCGVTQIALDIIVVGVIRVAV